MAVTVPTHAVAATRQAIEGAQRILALTHIMPDGDALGSLTAVGLILDQMGKPYRLVCDDGVFERFSFLPLSEIIHVYSGAKLFDLIIALDCGDMLRMGRAYDDLPEPKPPIVNIDHHITNTEFGEINLICQANSTTEILYAMLPGLGITLTPSLATSLLTGLVTDTLCFRTNGVRPDTLTAAAHLIEAGADLAKITTESLLLRPISSLYLWRAGLNNLRLEEGLLWTRISNEEREATGFPGSSTAGLVNALSDTYEAAIGMVLMEQPDGRVTVSFRCHPPYRVSELALNLGGGGHDLAAGCTLDGPLDAAEDLVVALTKETIRKQQRDAIPGGGG